MRDKDGNLVRKIKSHTYASAFTLCNYPRNSDEQCILKYENGILYFVDFNGKNILVLCGPGKNEKNQFDKACCVPVKLKENEKDYLAVLTYESHGFTDRAVLSIYSPRQELAYEEYFPENCSALATYSTADSNLETLLVGGTDKVWKFDLEVTKP